MKAYFVSDLHLKGPEDPNSEIFRGFLHFLLDAVKTAAPSERPTHLFLVGDIFDLWIGEHEYFIRSNSGIVELVRSLVECGVEVHFFEGNHDLHLEPFWREKLGVVVHTKAEYFNLGNLVVRVEHGDQMNPDDKGYIFLRWFLRTPVMKAAALHLPSSIVSAIGERASRASRNYNSTAKELSQERIRSIIRKHAERAYRERPFDFIISGHVHVVDDQNLEIDGKKFRSVNLGSWFEEPKVFVLTAGRAEFVSARRFSKQ